MISLKKVVENSRRKNDIENKILHPFASKFSIFFSWAFINLGFSPNQVTGLFFLCGLLGGALLYVNSLPLIVLSYILWRLHIILDISDGEVARFTKKYSLNGAYWDYMIHAFLYPWYFINMSLAQYHSFNEPKFLVVGLAGSFALSLLLASKNNYFRALLFNNVSISEYNARKKETLPRTSIKHQAFIFISELLDFEGLLLFYLLLNVSPNGEKIFIVMVLFTILIFAKALLKFILLSTSGYYYSKS